MKNIVLLLVLAAFSQACARESLKDTEGDIKAEIRRNNTCEQNSDCAELTGKNCAFQCGYLVNVAHRKSIQTKIDDFDDKCNGSDFEYDKSDSSCACMADCVTRGEPSCNSNKCEYPDPNTGAGAR